MYYLVTLMPDHSCNLPYFNELNGFNGRILSSYETIEISKQIIKNSVGIHENSIMKMRQKGKRKNPLYTKQDMWSMFDHMESVPQDIDIKLNEYVTVKFLKNNHVVGANSILLTIKDTNGRPHTLWYTGDMGCNDLKEFHPFTSELEVPKKCDLMISEATYSDKNREKVTRRKAKEEREYLYSLIKNSLNKGEDSQLLIPTFSFSRTQEFLVWFKKQSEGDKFFDNIPIYIDGVLVVDINHVYERILKDEELETFRDSMSIVKINNCFKASQFNASKREKRIVISSSGFLIGGMVENYLPSTIEHSNDTIIMLGYCGNEDSVAGNLLTSEIGKPINICNRTILKKCEVYQMKTWSSHIQYDNLMELFNSVKTPRILIHHCDEENKQRFCNEANEYLRDRNKTTKVIPVSKGSFEFKL